MSSWGDVRAVHSAATAQFADVLTDAQAQLDNCDADYNVAMEVRCIAHYLHGCACRVRVSGMGT